MTNLPPAPLELATNTVVGRVYYHFAHEESSTLTRILLIVAVAVIVHVLVKIIRHLSEWLINKSRTQESPLGFVTQQPKFITLTRLIVSAITFVIYFFAIGLILQEFGVSLMAYLASASVRRPGHQLRFAGPGPGRGHRPDADFFGRDGHWRHGGSLWRRRASSGAWRKSGCASRCSAILSIKWCSSPTAPLPM